MAFNADKYIDVIVEQIAKNFQELHKAVEACKKLEENEKKFRNTYDFIKYAKLADKINEQKTNLGEVICNKYKSIEPLSVGLFGEWGSGKTHLLKLIEKEINTTQLDENASDKEIKTFPRTTIPVFFNAWRFEKEEHLIVPLFQTLLASIETFEENNVDENIKKQIGRTKERLKILSFAIAKGFQIPKSIKSTVASLMSGDFSALSDFIDTDKVSKDFKEGSEKSFVTKKSLTKLLKSDRIESIYMNIPQWIEKITIVDNINFVFLIDDLDRCLPENTLKMLESIKLFLDVPSCAFVLAIDDDVVERGVAYHYRDYLQQNNNTIIHLHEEKVQNKKAEHQELPITGHEYLEKMIQLPFRIPVIGTDNVLEFLEENYRDSFEDLLEDKEEPSKKEEQVIRDFNEGKEQNTKTDEILKFFSKTIPPKPRKIKRTAMLFETKVRLLKSLGLERKDRLIAKITLLELFAPKLLRFMQNNDYERIYNRLVHFRGIESENKEETDEKVTLSLADVEEIQKHIESEEAKYTTKEKELFTKLMKIVTESRASRMVFELDAIFDKSESEEDLRLNIEMTKVKKKEHVPSKLTNFSEISLDKLFRSADVASWGDAFKDNKLLAEGEALLSNTELEEIIDKAKLNTEFAQDPQWMGIVAKYVSNDQYKHLLKELYDYRFADINGQFKMGIYQVTFAEYDRYCEVKKIEKPKDREWGRGKRPVINLHWYEVTTYAKWLTEVLKVEYKLSNENDWYLACNNGQKSKWYFGDKEKELKNYAWYNENSEAKTHPVGEKKENDFGLYDMHGNVWEWCEDWYGKKEETKVLRGGSWINYSNITESWYRGKLDPASRIISIGFRLQRTLH